MKPNWLIEDFDNDPNIQRLAEEVKLQGYNCELITYVPFQQGNYNVFDNNECVIFQGSLNLADQLRAQKNWIPGPWLNLEAYECTAYYPVLENHLFNVPYTMLKRCDFEADKEKWFNAYGVGNCLFIRPSSGFKTFTGKVFSLEHFDSDWQWVEEFSKPEDMIVVSSPKGIKAEWRFVVAEGKVISGSTYRLNNVSKYDREWPDNALIAAEGVAKNYEPDPVYCVDICQGMDDVFYLLEIGSFSCSGLYSCDMKPIVEVVSNIALSEWEVKYRC